MGLILLKLWKEKIRAYPRLCVVIRVVVSYARYDELHQSSLGRNLPDETTFM